MSQQSITLLAQPATTIFKPKKAKGGVAAFKPGMAGTALTLKYATQEHVKHLRFEDKVHEADGSDQMKLIDFHYGTARKTREERAHMCELPPKPVGAIPGYAGYLPRKDACGLFGCGYREGALLAAELFAEEQERVHLRDSNVKNPESTLETPALVRI